MNSLRYKIAVIVVVVAVVSAAGGYWFAHESESARAGQTSATAGRKVLYWYDPMVPNQRFDKPGKSPFMDMQLVPKYAQEGNGDETSIRIDPVIVQNLGVRFTTVEQGALSQPLSAVGSIVFNQRNVAIVQTRTNGFVTRVYARATGDVLERGAPLADMLVPEWAGGQAEFLALLKSADSDLVDAARTRLTLSGMPPDLITRVEVERKIQTTVTIRTPIAGAIESLEVREGMTVSSGATLARINGLEKVWMEAAIPESQGALTDIGKSAEVQLTAYPGEIFKGDVIGVLPETNNDSRTLRLRIELENPDGKLRPGMFAQVHLEGGNPTPVLYVASEAIIRTGTRNVVLVAGEQGRFTPTMVEIGAESNGKTTILRGLSPGQKVVASGQFLIDSEASLKGVLARLDTTGKSPDAKPAASVDKVERLP